MKNSEFSSGFSAGLKFWLFFMLSFALAGYSITLSVFFGAMGGLAGGWIFAWWKSKDQPSQTQPTARQSSDKGLTRMSGLRLAKQKRDEKSGKRGLSGRKVFSSLLRKKGKSP